MRPAAAGALAAVFASGCMLVVADVPDAGGGPIEIDAGIDSGVGGGGDVGDIGFGDGGDQRPVPGTGKDGDNGTAVLVLLRVDQGTANLADPVVTLLKDLIASVEKSGLSVTSAAVADLYVDQGLLWASRSNLTPPALADVLRTASALRTATPPDRCTSAALLADGTRLPIWNVFRIAPFYPPPGALLVVLIDTGVRPQALGGCAAQALWSQDPVQWALLGRLTHRAQTRFLLLATPESGTLETMRARCMAVPGFPTAALDALAPSGNPFFDPMASAMNAASAGLATRVDLCEALGSRASATWEDLGKRWYEQLELLR